jgi:hypothetical protein
VEDYSLLKLQRLQNKVLRTTGNLPKSKLTRDLHMTFKIPSLCDFVTKLRGDQATAILSPENVNIHITGQGKARHKK